MEEKIRSPILINLGHVDHGKTTLLDKIRGTVIAKAEPGLITQHISASYVPIDVIKNICTPLLQKIKIDIKIPGYLWIDSPGHEAFTTLRKRGGAIADLGVLVIDINEGFKPQTEESLNFLKQFKTPFLVAATKIDRIAGWNTKEGACFFESFNNQSDRAQEEFEKKLYNLVGQLGQKGFQAERYDRISDFSQQIAIVPVSGSTGEGIPDLLVAIGGISERFLKERLLVTPGRGRGTILEVKDFKGLGLTLDVILYDGEMRKGDFLVIGGEEITTTRIKALLEPKPLKELRSEKDFNTIDCVSAAAGVKVSAPDLEGVIAGSPVRSVSNEAGLEEAKREVEKEVSEVEIETDNQGAVLKADTLGSLEALVNTMKEHGIPIRKAHVGTVNKSDIMEIRTVQDPIIFAFGVKVSDEVDKAAKDNNIALFKSNVIYRLVEDHDQWKKDSQKREEDFLLDSVTRPGRVKVLPGYIFRQSKPAVFGVEVVKGIVKPRYRMTKAGALVGEIREIQLKGESTKQAEQGDKVAISMDKVVIGKDILEGDVLDTFIPEQDKEKLDKIKSKLRGDEKELLEEWEENG
jgi:translation initiation factor 5B